MRDSYGDAHGGILAKVKAMFFVPTKDNDGRPLQAEIDDLEMALTIHFVGWTFQGHVKGYYQMPDGTPCVDVKGYFVTINESRIEELVQILREFKGQTLQDAVYLEIHRNIEFRFIT